MINFLSYFWAFLILAISLLVLSLIPVIMELWRTMRDVRIIVDRLEMLSDVKGWINFAKAFRQKKK